MGVVDVCASAAAFVCGELREMAKSILQSLSPTTFFCMELEILILLFGLLN
jgi:hypothetical protein